jgi:electron transfer flavoprotein alpha subunit
MASSPLILILADHDNTRLHGSTLSAVTAATRIGGVVHVLVAGHSCDAVARASARIDGVDTVLCADDPTLANSLSEGLAAQVLAIARDYTHLMFSATAIGKSVAPRVAATLDVAQVSEITKVVAPDTFERPIYAGNAVATIRSADTIKVLTVRATGFDPAPSSDSAARIDAIPAAAVVGASRFIARTVSKSDRPELCAAKVIVSGGRALGSSARFDEVLTPLADALGAALGASRAAVDAGYAPNDWQVGQTGKIVAPSLYVACGISGAIQHLAGMKDSKVIVAINKDGEAPIFSVADYGLEADLFAAVPELVTALAPA